jgi:hypothetical protein
MSDFPREAFNTGPNIIVGMCRWMLQGTKALTQCIQTQLEMKHILSGSCGRRSARSWTAADDELGAASVHTRLSPDE